MSNPTPPNDPTSKTVGHFLTFVGPIMTTGGILAVWRTGDRDWFYIAFLPLGLILWALGFYLYHRRPRT